MDASLSTTLLHAITFLLTPLAPHFQPQTLDTLHLALLSSLSSNSTQTLVLSLHAPPPQPIQIALNALNVLPPSHRVSYQDWLIILSRGNQVILSIAPGFVQAATKNPLTNELSFNTIWDAAATAAANSQRRAPSPWGPCMPSRSRSSASSSSSDSSRSSTPSSLSLEHHHLHQIALPVPSPAVAVVAAENVLRGLEDDEDDLVLLARPTRNPAPANPWAVNDAASLPKFSARPKQASPSSTRSRSEYQHHSRSSSRSSTVSSTAPSLVSCSTNTSAASAASLAHTLSALTISSSRGSHSRANSSSLSLALSNTSTLSSSPEPPSPTPSMDDPSEDVTCYIDASKNQSAVTEYECGKVGVLTGAVMLGVPSAGKAKAVPPKNMPTNKMAPVLPPIGVIRTGGATPGATQGFKKNANTVWNKRNSFVRI